MTLTTLAIVTDQNMTAFLMVNGSEPTYGRLHVINSTHAHWQLLSGMVGREGEILDMFWLIQEHHGKFQMEELPKEVTHQIDQNLVSQRKLTSSISQITEEYTQAACRSVLVSVCVCVCVCVCVHICVYVCWSVSLYVDMHVYMY